MKITGIFYNRIFFLLILFFSQSCNQEPGQTKKTYDRTGDDPYLTEKYWALNNSPMQERLRKLCPFPVGVVYYQQRGDDLDSAKKEFEVIKSLGFTALKQVQLVSPDNPDHFRDSVFHAAINTGITPWYYGKGGWIDITQKLVDSLGIAMEVNKENMPAIQSHPAMIAFQHKKLHERVNRMKSKPEKPRGMGEPGRNNPYMPERLIPYFAEWLKGQYETIDNLKEAWNCGYTGTCHFNSFSEAATELRGTGLDQFGNGTGKSSKDFRRFRDAMKFQSELIVENYTKTMHMFTEWDPDEPERTGGHQIFENQAMNTWDLEGQAKAASIGGSFYSSIHLAHHFFLVNGEITRPVYLQARTVADMFKGGWAATWESTGGPTQWSGYQGYTVNGDVMRQLMISYLAAGLKGIGFWMWNSRGEGWEVGEYALTNIQGQPSVRARQAGKISNIIQQYRFELWDLLDEPLVGILYSWENEAMLGRLSMGAYPLNTPVYETDHDKQFRQYHSQAKTGISRALMNNNIPFEYVTERDIKSGLAPRYPVIFMPYVIALDQETIKLLMEYVENGGRIVADMPLLMLDTYGRLNKQRAGSDFDQLFGFQTKDYYNTFNAPRNIDGMEINGQFGDIRITSGTISKTFDNGQPAMISSRYGKGTTTVMNFEAGRMVFHPGNKQMEEFIVKHTLDKIHPVYASNEESHSLVFRRTNKKTDHYFIINDGDGETITISSNFLSYGQVQDLIDEQPIKTLTNGFRLWIPENSGKWIRCERD